ncbi:iron complex transport system ATP-binding protein [Alteromonadaceae bacterium 2753L.S.0a.02]|nr:iron complex transport system ATP-binding protein [Alteromonadaceae bacterium 2753L.S.0a.02]
MAREPILTLKNATVFRGGRKVFDKLSLELNCGEHTAILGPNGAGKTTLLKLISRELRPVVKEGSTCALFGKTLFNLWDLRQQIGVVSHEFQNDYRSLASGLEVVLSAYFGSVGIHGHHKVSEAQRRDALALMEEMNIIELREQRYLELSTGQQRRLLLARALIHQPRVLIFDEPTAGLDMGSALQVLTDLRRLAKKNITLILVTHHLNEIIPEISRVILLNRGTVFSDGNKADVLSSATISELYGMPLIISEHLGYFQVTPK